MRFRAFPVAVTIDGTLYDPVLILGYEDRTEVWAEGPTLLASHPQTTARERVKGLMAGRPLRFLNRFADGSALEVAKSEGCGCGHALKRWTPPAEVSA